MREREREFKDTTNILLLDFRARKLNAPWPKGTRAESLIAFIAASLFAHVAFTVAS